MHVHIQRQLDTLKVNCEHLQAWIAEHADISSLNTNTRELLKSKRLSVVELLSIAFLANEGLVLFKRLENANEIDKQNTFTPSNKENFHYEAIFKHVAAVENIENIENIENKSSNDHQLPKYDWLNTESNDNNDNNDNSDIIDTKLDDLISAIDLDEDIPSWLDTDAK